MQIRLFENGWRRVLTDGIQQDHSSVRIVSPFIKLQAVKDLLKNVRPKTIEVITRFNLNDFAKSVSDISALRWLLKRKAMIRGIRNLHAKLYLFGQKQAVVTSANLTTSALDRNHEFGFAAEDDKIINFCQQYFDGLWSSAGENLNEEDLTQWQQQITAYLAGGASPSSKAELPDLGVNIGLPREDLLFTPSVESVPQSFVKFFGQSGKRSDRTETVFEEVVRSGSHFACTYPKGRRPRSVQDGAVMFLARMVKEHDDILIYGRAIGMKHVPDRDDASADDLKNRPWKKKWPHYVRVHHAEFVAGTLGNGISLNELLTDLGANAFMPTQRNIKRGEGNTDPRRAYNRKPSVELTPEGYAWMNDRLQAAFRRFGTLSPAELEQLDWPSV